MSPYCPTYEVRKTTTQQAGKVGLTSGVCAARKARNKSCLQLSGVARTQPEVAKSCSHQCGVWEVRSPRIYVHLSSHRTSFGPRHSSVQNSSDGMHSGWVSTSSKSNSMGLAKRNTK